MRVVNPQMIGQSTPASDPGHPSRDAGAGSVPVTDDTVLPAQPGATRPVEIGGRDGLDPTRYGDWEKNGRCIDF